MDQYIKTLHDIARKVDWKYDDKNIAYSLVLLGEEIKEFYERQINNING